MSAAPTAVGPRPTRLALRALGVTVRRFAPLVVLAVPGAAAASIVMLAYTHFRDAGLAERYGPTFDLQGSPTLLWELVFQGVADGVAAGLTGGAVAAAIAARGVDGALKLDTGLSALVARKGTFAALGLLMTVISNAVILPIMVLTDPLADPLADAGLDPMVETAGYIAAVLVALLLTLYATVWIGAAVVLAAIEPDLGGPRAALRRATRLTTGRRLRATLTGGMLLVVAIGLWTAGVAAIAAAFGGDIFAAPRSEFSYLAEQTMFAIPINLALSVWLALWVLAAREQDEGGDAKVLEAVFD